MNSGTVFAGIDGVTVMTSGTRTMPATPAMSRRKLKRRLLRARHYRQSRRAPEPRDELAPFHWIDSSAVASSISGMVMPRALAVLRLMTNSNTVGCWTGRSAGLTPLSTCPT